MHAYFVSRQSSASQKITAVFLQEVKSIGVGLSFELIHETGHHSSKD